MNHPDVAHHVSDRAREIRTGSLALRTLQTQRRSEMILSIKDALATNSTAIFEANKKDIAQAQCADSDTALIKRLTFDKEKLHEVCVMLETTARLPDMLYTPLARRELSVGLTLTKRRVPIGVIAMIFESRPDALIQIIGLCIKSANGIMLKGGSEANHTNRALMNVIHEALKSYGITFACLLHTREEAMALTTLTDTIDVIIPRGSKEFVASIMRQSAVPALGHADGVCHTYIHKDADLRMAASVLLDAKTQYPAVCNATECVLVHTKAVIFLPQLLKPIADAGVKIHADTNEAYGILYHTVPCVKATNDDWGKEYLNNEIAVKIVHDEHEAVDFINTHGSHHTDAIITRDASIAKYFQDSVDSASVMWNCSTRFADGYRYGLGAEVGISTSRIHARGPMGVEELFTTQWVVDGNGDTVSPFARGEKNFTHKDMPLPDASGAT